MHSVKLALVSALLVAGCAADDNLSVGAGAADSSLSATAAAENGTATTRTATTPDLAAERTASTSATAPETAGETTAATSTTTPADTTRETTTTTTPTTTPADTTRETTTTTTPTTTPADTTSMPEEPGVDGFAVFVDATCDVCHRADGEGADLSASMLHIDAVIEVIRFGVTDTKMEGWDFEPKPPGLTRAEIEAVAAYVMSLRNG